MEIKKNNDNCHFITIITHGFTDVTAQENELIYVQICNLGCAEILYIAFQEMLKADISGFFKAISKSMDSLNLEDYTKKVLAYAADEDSVNIGTLSGLIFRMRFSWALCIVMLKCLVHCLEVAMKDSL